MEAMSGRRPVRPAFVKVGRAMGGRVPGVLGAAAIVVLAAGCAQSEARTPLVAGSQAPVVIPGAPGEPGRTAEPGGRIGDSEARPAAADVRFAEMMIPHHRQALEMAGLV